MRKMLAVFTVFLMLFLISCGAQDIPVNEGVSFTDALGREVCLAECPRRTAALVGSFADVWMLSGGTVVATANDAWEDFGLELGSAVNIGGAHSPSLELLLSADPDFVIASASTASNVAMLDTLSAMGITVAYFDVDSFGDYLEMLRICTLITGRDDLYEKNGLALAEQIDSFRDAYRTLDIPDSERKILLLRASSTTVKVKGSSGTILGEMLDDIGCINIADSDTTLLEELNVESIIREEPYRIFVVTMGNDTAAAEMSLRRMIEGNSAWNTLDAVKYGRLYVMDKTLYNIKPNARFALAYEGLYGILTEK